ncbi:phage portal protein [uncultured Mediterranean phage uvMED]|nr:phage portal protein [uncultured Mediterranean phage uvMED]
MYSGFSSRQRVGNVTTVESPNTAFVNMEPHWLLIEALLQGTYGIRKGHRKFLPQEVRELDEAYDNRLMRSTLAPFYARLERMLAGMLTRKPVRLEDVSNVITEHLFDVDLQGNDLNVWTYETARKCIRYGHVGVLVDAPKAGDNGRPYWTQYTPRDCLGWRSEIKDGKQALTQLRLMEEITVPDGLYGEKQVQQVRVLTPGAFEIHQKDKKGDFVLIDEGTTSLSEIPFAVAYSNRVGVLESRPPLADIAELNLKAYQVQSDLDNQLHISAVPMLAIYGFPQSAEEISAGPGEALALPESARSEYIEPSGNSYDAQFKRLDQISQQINELGLAAVLGQKLSAETAEAKRIDRSQGDSTMMVIAQQMQDLIDNCLGFHAQYMQQAQAGSSFINRDFLATRLEPQEIQSLLQLYTAGTITQETLLNQLSAGEVLGDEFDVEEEIEATQTGGLIEMQQPEPTPPAAEEATMREGEPEAEDELAG